MAYSKKVVRVVPRLAHNYGSIYARKGEKIYCAGGAHVLGVFKKDVKVGEEQNFLEQVETLQEGLKIGQTCCRKCGKALTAGPGIYYFEIGGGE